MMLSSPASLQCLLRSNAGRQRDLSAVVNRFRMQCVEVSGIPVYRIANLPERWIEVYADPSGPRESPDYR